MAHYRQAGEIPPGRHTRHRTPGGGLHDGEPTGEEGFSSDSSPLDHRCVPSAVTAAAPGEGPGRTPVGDDRTCHRSWAGGRADR